MQLLQGGVQSDTSPLFSIFMAALHTSVPSASATTTIPATTGTGGATATTYIYLDEHCGCTKTALAPAATEVSTNYSTPALTTPEAPASPASSVPVSTYTGAATSLQGAWLPSSVFGAMLLAIFA
jgi:hypothetical protein